MPPTTDIRRLASLAEEFSLKGQDAMEEAEALQAKGDTTQALVAAAKSHCWQMAAVALVEFAARELA